MDRLVTVRRAPAEPAEPAKAAEAGKAAKAGKAPVPYEDPAFGHATHAQFTPPTKEKNVPEPAPIVDATFGAMEVESEEEPEDEWDVLMREAEDQQAAEASVESFAGIATPDTVTDDAESPWLPHDDDGTFFTEGYTPDWVAPSSLRGRHRKEKKKKVFSGEPLEFDAG